MRSVAPDSAGKAVQVKASVPVKVGMAGPASVAGLLRYAKRCGVSASLRGLMAGTGRGLVGHAGPDDIIAALEAAGIKDIVVARLEAIAPAARSSGVWRERAEYPLQLASRVP